jgi:hypothetical protein
MKLREVDTVTTKVCVWCVLGHQLGTSYMGVSVVKHALSSANSNPQ